MKQSKESSSHCFECVAQVYNQPAPPARPAYNKAPPRPYLEPAYSSLAPSYSAQNPREQCVCVAIEQCASYDIIGRGGDYSIDPRSKNRTIVSPESDTEEASEQSSELRRKRSPAGSTHNRQTIIGDDSITVISADDSLLSNPSGGSVSATTTTVRPTPGDETPSDDSTLSGVAPAGDLIGTGTGAAPVGGITGTGVGTIAGLGDTDDGVSLSDSCYSIIRIVPISPSLRWSPSSEDVTPSLETN